jgi:hypothetical protein
MVEKPKSGGKVEISGVWTEPNADGDMEKLQGGRFFVPVRKRPLVATAAPGLH